MIDVLSQIQPELAIINATNETISVSKWKRVETLYKIREKFTWKDTPYGSFIVFIEKTFPEKNTETLYVQVSVYSKMMSLKYTDKDIKTIALNTYFSNASKVIQQLKKKIPVKEIISLSKTIFSRTDNNSTHVKDVNTITFHLPREHMVKLEGLLIAYGLGTGIKKRRYNLTEAMISLIDSLVP